MSPNVHSDHEKVNGELRDGEVVHNNQAEDIEYLSVVNNLNSGLQSCSLSSVSLIQTISEVEGPVEKNTFPIEHPLPDIPPEFDAGPQEHHLHSFQLNDANPTPQSELAMTSARTNVNPYGTRFGKNHSSYLLMHFMLAGIHSAVSKEEERNRSQPIPTLVIDLNKKSSQNSIKFILDYPQSEKSPLCSCLSTSSILFKDYAPDLFGFLRNKFFITSSDYLSSLTSRYVLSELGSPGRSGSFFYYSHDYRFLIKTIGKLEQSCLLALLPEYCAHIEKYPNTLLTRFLGLYRISGLPSRSSSIYFVVMGNVFPPSKDIHEIYDLKGSFHGRQVPPRKLTRSPREPRKDLNWLRSGKKLVLSNQKALDLIKQLEQDVAFLTEHNIMDYSLLIGIHSIERGNKEKIRDNALSVVQTTTIEAEGYSHHHHYRPHRKHRNRQPPSIRSGVVGFARPLNQDDPVSLLTQSEVIMDPSLPTHPSFTSMISGGNPQLPAERSNFAFYNEEGGIFSGTDDATTISLPQQQQQQQRLEKPIEIYYLGIIDILTPYSCKKQLEHVFKSIYSPSLSISSVSPSIYGRRFLTFLKRCVLKLDLDQAEPSTSKLQRYLSKIIMQSEYELSLANSLAHGARDHQPLPI